jgi:hypothetical protein
MGVEGDFVNGDSKGAFAGGGSPDAARARIAELRKDTDFVRRYSTGDVAAHGEMERLHRVAYPA